MEINEIYEVLRAYESGKKIESCRNWMPCEAWELVEGTPLWNFADFEYRVAGGLDNQRKLMTNRQLSELLAKGFGDLLWN